MVNLNPEGGAVKVIGGPTANKIVHIQAKTFPNFRFEWHPEVEKVYYIDLVNAPGVGQCLSEHSEDYGRAFGHVQTFLRGYQLGAKIGIIKPASEQD